MLVPHDDIIKAQSLYHKMVGSCGPKCFKKLFVDAISQHTLDEFYPVVVTAEISAAITLAAKAKREDNALDFYEYLENSFGLKPKHLVNLTTETIAYIMETDTENVEDMLRLLDFTIENGLVIGHPDLGRQNRMQFINRVKRVKTGTSS